MFNFRPTYEPLIKFCKELIAEKKALMEENEGLKETLRCIRQDNQELRAKLFSKPNNDKVADFEKRVEHLEYLLTPEEPAEEKLKVGKGYDARTFKVEKLKELLPVGTQVAIIQNSHVDEAEVINEEEDNHITRVSKIVEEFDITKGRKQTVVYADIYEFVPNNWFKIIKEY